MYIFEDYLNKNVILYTRTSKFKGILIEYNGNEEYLITCGHYAHCLLSTSDGIIEIPDKDIIGIFCENKFLCTFSGQRKKSLMNHYSDEVKTIGGFCKELVQYFSLMEEAKNSLPSKSLKMYLESDEYWDCFISNRDKGWNSYPSWSCLQLLTIAFNYMSSRKRVRYIRRIAKEMDCSSDEKTFVRMCARDFAKNKYRGRISSRTLNFYYKHLHISHGAIYPLDELLFLPVIFKAGDVVVFRYKREKPRYYIILTCPDYKSALLIYHSDETYTVLELDDSIDLQDEQKYYCHRHFNSEELELVPDEYLPKQYHVLVEELRYRHGLKNHIKDDILPISKQYAENLKRRFYKGLDYLNNK